MKMKRRWEMEMNRNVEIKIKMTINWIKLILYQHNKIEFTNLIELHIIHQNPPKMKMFLIIT